MVREGPGLVFWALGCFEGQLMAKYPSKELTRWDFRSFWRQFWTQVECMLEVFWFIFGIENAILHWSYLRTNFWPMLDVLGTSKKLFSLKRESFFHFFADGSFGIDFDSQNRSRRVPKWSLKGPKIGSRRSWWVLEAMLKNFRQHRRGRCAQGQIEHNRT